MTVTEKVDIKKLEVRKWKLMNLFADKIVWISAILAIAIVVTVLLLQN